MNPTYQLLTPSAINQKDSIQTPNVISSRTNSSTTNLSSSANVLPNETLTIINDEQELPPSPDLTKKQLSTSIDLTKLKDIFNDISSLIKHLLLNLRYLGITCSAIVEALLIKGYLAFLSKHIEYQFRTTSSHSSVYIGVISLFSVNIFF
jgi:hypothetical protein